MIDILFIASGLFLAIVLLVSANNTKKLFLLILKIVMAYVIVILMIYCIIYFPKFDAPRQTCGESFITAKT